jgi:Gpi18-like mannosyltransferase
MNRRLRIWALLAYLALRWVLLTLPGYTADVLAYKRWAVQAARFGISQVYRTSDMDYPPLYAWILAPLGKIYGLLSPEKLNAAQDSPVLTVLIKFPPLLFDLLIAALAFWFGRILDRRPPERGIPWTGSWRWILPAAYLLNPVILFNEGYWGQADSIHSFFLTSAFVALAWFRKGPGRMVWPAWVLLTLATLMKPLGAPFLPLLLVLSLVLYGLRSTLVGMLAAGLAALLVFSPFLATGHVLQVLRRVVGDVGLMAYTSSNAHNLWWLLGSWRNSEAPWLGPLTPTQIGLSLFALVYLGLLWTGHRLHHSQEGGLDTFQILALALGVGISFFMLSTHMHENHMFVAIPLCLLLLAEGKRWRWLYAAISLGIFSNLILHDPDITLHWPFTIGGLSGLVNHHLKRPFYRMEIGLIWASTVFNLCVFGTFLYGVFRPHGWLRRREEQVPPLLERPVREAPADRT